MFFSFWSWYFGSLFSNFTENISNREQNIFMLPLFILDTTKKKLWEAFFLFSASYSIQHLPEYRVIDTGKQRYEEHEENVRMVVSISHLLLTGCHSNSIPVCVNLSPSHNWFLSHAWVQYFGSLSQIDFLGPAKPRLFFGQLMSTSLRYNSLVIFLPVLEYL